MLLSHKSFTVNTTQLSEESKIRQGIPKVTKIFKYLKWRNPHLYKLYGYGLYKGNPTPKIAENKVIWKPSILGTWNFWRKRWPNPLTFNRIYHERFGPQTGSKSSFGDDFNMGMDDILSSIPMSILTPESSWMTMNINMGEKLMVYNFVKDLK